VDIAWIGDVQGRDVSARTLVSTMAALPVSVMPAGRSTPLAVLPLSVASRVSFSLPSKTASSVVGTVTTMPPVVPAGTWKL
jgi:hypothetical protein